ncbi:hypothetical protein [Rickettsia montanensis]|nr:hypothetical protein [Rickettsia montanensis]
MILGSNGGLFSLFNNAFRVGSFGLLALTFELFKNNLWLGVAAS